MPRIDPERLLKCLQPLLDSTSGAIRSCDEVDKILGLMSKFSKKLVSKCIYINILRASHDSVVDLFMERGGWNLVFGWTNDGIANKNYSLLKEVLKLLLRTPVSINRLKSNRFPIVIKNFSKECEDEETKNLCKQVVSKWIGVAKEQEQVVPVQHQPVQQLPATPQPSVSPVVPSPQPQPPQPQQCSTFNSISSGGDNNGVPPVVGELPNLGNMNTDHLLNIDPSSMIPDDGLMNNLMDIDLTSDLGGFDFGSDMLSKMVTDVVGMEDPMQGMVAQQQQQIIGGDLINVSAANGAPISVIQHAPAPIQIHPHSTPQIIHQQGPPQQVQVQPQQIIFEQQQGLHPQVLQHSQVHSHHVILTPQQAAPPQPPQIQIIQQQPPPQILQPVQQQEPQYSLVQVQPSQSPRLFIKTTQGQRTVVQNLPSDSGQYALMVRDGKNYLVRLKEQPNVVVTSASPQLGHTSPPPPPQQPSQQPAAFAKVEVPEPKVPPLVLQKSQDVPDSASVLKKPKGSKKDPQVVTPANKVPGDISKTYSKTKSGSSGSSKEKKGENVKPGSSEKEKDHHKSSSSSSSSSKSKEGHHHKKKSSSSSSKAALAAAEAKEAERALAEKVRREKAQMKKRHKEAEKEKEQKKKDQETLKKLNLIPGAAGSTTSSSSGGTSTSSTSPKIPKIPKKNNSFLDAIAVPGSDGMSAPDKIKKVSGDKGAKEKGPLEDVTMTSPTRKFYGKKEEEVAAEQEKKERRHKAKVYVSSKSRSEDLLKEMESGKKPGKEKEKEKEEKEKEVKPVGVNLGNSIPATPPKMTKRLSTDSLEKPGDAKKAKLEKDKEKTSPGEKKESVKDRLKKSVAAAAAITLKESSLFMDALSAGAESKTSKKKRRTSSGGDKDAPKLGELSAIAEGGADEVVTTPVEEPKKPVFNFYRDTLNDEDDSVSESDSKKEETSGGAAQSESDRMEEDETSGTGSFTPQGDDGKIKGVLVLMRPRNRKKKKVQWREEEDLREFHYFEMDENERVNVTKQKDFTEFSSTEKMMEGSFLKRRTEEEEQEKSKPWKLHKIHFHLPERQPIALNVISTEIEAQEEREKMVLGLFLPPGSILPDSPVEPDVEIPGDKPEPKLIPVEDVNTITKVCDYRTHPWPAPKDGPPVFGMLGRGGQRIGMPLQPNQRSQMDHFGGPDYGQFGQSQVPHQYPPQMVAPPQSSPASNVSVQDYNPWSSGFNVPPTGVPPPSGGDLGGFGQFGGAGAAALNMGLIGQVPPPVQFPPNPFAFPPPPTALMNGPPPSVPGSGGTGIMDFGRGSSVGSSHRGGSSRFEGGERRNNFHGRGGDGGRDRDRSSSRDRDYRDRRGGGDRDYRKGDRNERDYRNHHDRDRGNSRDNRGGGGRNIRKEIPCRFFQRGFCSNGDRCEFLHDTASPNSEGRSRRSPSSDQPDNHRHHSSSSSSRHHSSSNNSSSNSNEEDDWEATNNIPDSAQSPPQEEQTVNPHHQPRTTSRFSDAPMSPTDDSPSSPVGSYPTAADATKVIPV